MPRDPVLLPCPFCGGPAKAHTGSTRDAGPFICCADERCMGYHYEQDEQGGWNHPGTAEAWNKRAAPTVPPTCLTCWWWGLRDSASIPECNRQCHRFPPIATRSAEGEMESEWPWTNQRDYCGEHRTSPSPNQDT